jgi:hypothetical protein
VLIDNHSKIKRLVKLGMNEELAEEIVNICYEIMSEKVITKEYLDGRLSKIEAKIQDANDHFSIL